MKKIIYLLFAGIVACHSERAPEAVPILEPQGEEQAEDQWITFEGRVPLDEKSYLFMEVSIRSSGSTGEGSYELRESVEAGGTLKPFSSFRGKYSTLFGKNAGEQILQLHQSAHEKGVKRSYITAGFQGDFTRSTIRMIREEQFRKTDLALKAQGKNRLIVLDENLQPVSSEAHFNLTRRSSRLFTVEGYFRHNGDTADFVESNTKERWAISKLGDYPLAINQYYTLTTRKFEVAYLKAVGFTVRHINKEGKEIDALVFKRILQMSTAPDLKDEYNPLPPQRPH